MKPVTLILSLLFLVSSASAGLFSAFQDPPVSLSISVANSGVNVTNTSDTVIHAVTASTPDGKTTVVIADTIEPHKTVFFKHQSADLWGMFFAEFKVTCKGYGSMKVKLPIQ